METSKLMESGFIGIIKVAFMLSISPSKVLIDGGENYKPPDSIGANFYPLLGPYSSIDPKSSIFHVSFVHFLVIDAHMLQLVQSRIGIICMSWWGQRNSDSQLKHLDGYTDDATSLIMNHAEKYGIKVCFHHEPYEGRTAASVREDLKYVMAKYGNHPAFFRWKEHGNRPLFFVYDSYLTQASDWATILSPNSQNTIRGTDIDSIMIALFVQTTDEDLIVHGNFDGAYTYFAANGFTFGSTFSNWNQISRWAKSQGKIFIPSVGPGYDDTRIR